MKQVCLKDQHPNVIPVTSARRIWKDYFTTVDAVVFMVDAADRTRFNEAREELKVIIQISCSIVGL